MEQRFQVQLDRELGDGYLPSVSYVGAGDLPSRFAVSALAAESFSRAGAWLARYRDGHAARETQVSVDRVLASRWFGWSLRPIGWQTPSVWDPIAGDYRCADGWIRLHTNAPVHRRSALLALGLGQRADRDSVAAAVELWAGEALESEVVAHGGCAAQLRRAEQWSQHPQGRAVLQLPLVSHREVSATVQLQTAAVDIARPLAGLKVLDLTRVLAGPVAGRFLAAYGAQVLRIDPPDWDEPGVVPEVTLGKRCAGLDLRNSADREVFGSLLRRCDVLLHGYRPGALDALGFGEQWRQGQNPRLIDVSLSAYGGDGPWAQRRGFDSLVQMSTGIAWPTESGARPSPLPVQALDHATGYLMAAAVLRGLTMMRERELACSSRLSLAGTAALLCAVTAPQAVSAMPEESDADLCSSHEQTEWGLARRLRFPLKLEGAEASWMIPAGSLRRHKPCW